MSCEYSDTKSARGGVLLSLCCTAAAAHVVLATVILLKQPVRTMLAGFLAAAVRKRVARCMCVRTTSGSCC
jgi:hypothetical protein